LSQLRTTYNAYFKFSDHLKKKKPLKRQDSNKNNHTR